MSRLSFAGAACAVWLAASPVAAEPFANFVDMCLRTDVDRQAAGARAKAIGWYAMPIDAETADESEMEDGALFLSVDPTNVGDKGMPNDLEMLVTGWGSGEQVFDVGGVRMDACIIMTVAGGGDFAARLEETLGFAPVDFDGEKAWAFSRVGAGFRSESDLLLALDEDPESLRTLANERKIYIAGVLEEDGLTGLMLAALRPGE